jgi:hypothetical protein
VTLTVAIGQNSSPRTSTDGSGEQCNQIGRIYSFWANLLLSGKLLLLSKFTPFGQIYSFWANLLLLGKFTPCGRLFTLGICLKIEEVGPISGLLFPPY